MRKKTPLILAFLLLVGLAITLPAVAAPQQGVPPDRYEKMVKDTLATMERTYEQKNLRAFMDLVSPDFAGDDFLMYRAVRRDFRFFDDIRLSLYVDSFSVDTKGRAQVTVKYTRSVIANRDGRTYRDTGLTQLTFHVDEGRAKLYDMKFPMVFGLSEGLQMATGVVRTAETSTVLVLDRRGNVYVLPFKEAMDIASGASVMRGMVYLATSAGSIQSFSLADNAKITAMTLQGDFGWDLLAYLTLKPGTKWLDMPPGSFDSTTEAPDPAATAYATTGLFAPAAAGQVYVLQLANNKFAMIEIVSVSLPGPTVSGTVRYKYQPNGSRFF